MPPCCEDQTCPNCGRKDTPVAELYAYRRCEDCWVDGQPQTYSAAQPRALRDYFRYNEGEELTALIVGEAE